MAHGVTFEDIWTLFLESGFLYPEKVERLAPVLPEIQRSVRALLESNGDLAATVAVPNGRGLEAQISMLRWLERTWMVQHLAALPLSSRTHDASAQITIALIYYGRLRPDIEWGKMFFRPNNAWPARVFGGFANRLNDPATSDLRVYHYLAACIEPGERGEAVPGVEVWPASSSEDFALVENWFRSRGRVLELQANELEAHRRGQPANTADYRAAGLERRREIVMAGRQGRATAFAILEISSLGLNFSELTNSFTVHAVEDDPCARFALARAARATYAALGRRLCIGLEESDDLEAFQAAGFQAVKDYACWTFHRQHFADMEEYFINLFTARRRGEK